MNIGCSSFSWQTIDGKHLLGRTYDYFGNLDSNSFVVIPRNYEFSTLIETKSMVKSEYVVTGMNINGLDTPFLVDGFCPEITFQNIFFIMLVLIRHL